MTTLNTSEPAAQQTAARGRTLIVDGDYLHHAFKKVLKRRPTSGDLEKLKRWAGHHHGGAVIASARFIQVRQTFPGAAELYAELERLNYVLILAGKNFEFWRDVKHKLLAELSRLSKTNHGLLYIGGNNYGGQIEPALRNMRLCPDGSERDVQIAHFRQCTEFSDWEFHTLDIKHHVTSMTSCGTPT